MPDSRDNLLRELTAAAAHHDQQFAAAAAPIDTVAIAKSLTWPIGSNVLDLVTGQKGVVVDGQWSSVLLSGSTVQTS